MRSRDYNTDVFNTKNTATNGTNGVNAQHTYNQEDGRNRTSYQDSNIFGYKDNDNNTWQNSGRDQKHTGIKSGGYINALKSQDNVIYDPTAMSESFTNSRQSLQQPTPELYHQHDSQVSKSRLGHELYGTEQFNRQTAKQELFPNDEYWLRHVDNKKETHEGLTPQERRQRDNLGNNIPNVQVPQNQLPVASAKLQDNVSHWRNPHSNEKRSNVHTDVNTFERRTQELSSANNPLTTTDYSHFTPKTKKQENYENVESRSKDAFYSDLFSQPGQYAQSTTPAKKFEVSSMSGIFSKEGISKGNRWNDGMSAAQRRQDFMRTSAFDNGAAQPDTQQAVADDHHINMARAELRTSDAMRSTKLQSNALHNDEFNKRYGVVRDHKEIDVFTIMLTNLPPTTDAETIKAISGAKHVVRAAVQTDNIKNQCTGIGEITIRLFEEESKQAIINRFLAAGIICQDKPVVQGKKDTFSMLASTGWKNTKMIPQGKADPFSTWENDNISKLQNSNGNNWQMDANQYAPQAYTNDTNGVYQAQQPILSQNELIDSLNKMSLRPQTAQPTPTGAFNGQGAPFHPSQAHSNIAQQLQEQIRRKYY
jgi:hypothetical protein